MPERGRLRSARAPGQFGFMTHTTAGEESKPALELSLGLRASAMHAGQEMDVRHHGLVSDVMQIRYSQNSHLHDAFSANEPPIVGPMAAAKDHVRTRNPWYTPRSARGTRSDVMIEARLMMPPPPIPWTA